jgi:hypothetical protein
MATRPHRPWPSREPQQRRAVSVGRRGAWYTAGRRGQRVTAGCPGTGLKAADCVSRPANVVRPARVATLLAALTIAFGLPAAAKPVGPLADPITHTAGWSIDSQSGCALWNRMPQRDESVTWSGACVNGLASGPGVAQWYKNGQIQPAGR